MSLYQPDKFLVLKMMPPGKPTFYKIFGTWSGGYLDGDSWRLNSGITKVEDKGLLLHFHGHTGSVYEVHKETYGASAYTWGIVNGWLKESEGKPQPFLEAMPEETDWVNFDWTG